MFSVVLISLVGTKLALLGGLCLTALFIGTSLTQDVRVILPIAPLLGLAMAIMYNSQVTDIRMKFLTCSLLM